uniref:Nucleotidyltransferase domain-containing protein n=1 Tax=Desulfatirhabdium butyrativorans TaxID=340467 RepID=A0A7C4MP36_9BACT
MPADHSQAPSTDRLQGDGLPDTAFSAEAWKTSLKKTIDVLIEACLRCYGERLVSIVLFGSVGRGTSNPHSDIDLLIVAEHLPKGRMQRVQEFGCIEQALQPLLSELSSIECHVELSPVFKTPEELTQGTPLMLDMVEDACILYDPSGFFEKALARLTDRLKDLGAKRVWRGNAWWWDLKPDYRSGEVFEI